jgi:hypothetical protein
VRLSVWYTTLALLGACARPAPVVVPPDHFFVPLYPALLGYGVKRVIDKQAPITLVAHDGSVCRTSRDRFARTRTGKWIACVWNFPSLDSTASAQLTLLK